MGWFCTFLAFALIMSYISSRRLGGGIGTGTFRHRRSNPPQLTTGHTTPQALATEQAMRIPNQRRHVIESMNFLNRRTFELTNDWCTERERERERDRGGQGERGERCNTKAKLSLHCSERSTFSFPQPAFSVSFYRVLKVLTMSTEVVDPSMLY